MTGIDKPVRPPGDDKHLSRLLDIWARAEDSGDGQPVIAGRLRRLVGVLVIVGALDGLRDAEGNERIGFKGARPSSCASGSRPGPRRILTLRTAASSRRRWS